VVPEFEDKEPPPVLRLTEAPDTALPPEVTVTVIVEDCEVVTPDGFAVTWTESDWGIATYVPRAVYCPTGRVIV